MREHVDYIITKMKQIGYATPDVTRRQSNQVKFIYRKKRGKDYEFRIDVDRNKIHCLLYINPQDQALLNDWEEEMYTSNNKKLLVSKDLRPSSPSKEVEAVMDDVQRMIKS